MCGMTTTSAKEAKPDHHRERDLRKVFGWLAVAVGFGIGLVVLGAVMSPDREDLWLDAAKAGIQLVVAGIVGGALNAAWKVAEERRADQRKTIEAGLQEKREIHERQLAMFVKIVAAYNGVKAVRRTLKSLGLKYPEGTLDSTQVAGFHAQMSRLNELQLVFEAMTRELGETDLFKPDTAPIAKELEAIADYLNNALSIWEDCGWQVREGARKGFVVVGLRPVVDTSQFKSGVVQPRRHLTEAMHRQLFGLVSTEKLKELAEREQNQDR